MGIAPKFTKQDVKGRFDAFLQAVKTQQIKRCQRLGEMCVTHAKLVPPEKGFYDRTGNARASIGFVVFADGVPVTEQYEGNPEGIEAGKNIARNAIKRHPADTVGVIVTAGMHYCVYLEAMGRDVLTSAEELAKRQLPKMLEQLVANIEKATSE